MRIQSLGGALLVAFFASAAVAQSSGEPRELKPVLDGKDITLQPFKFGSPTQAFYPPQAQKLGIEGHVILMCDIRADLELSCMAESESPTNMGFGESAVQLFDQMHVQPLSKHGEPVSGRRVRIRFQFSLH